MFEALTPTCVPDTLNALGYVPDEGMCFRFGFGIEVSWTTLYKRIWVRDVAIPIYDVTKDGDLDFEIENILQFVR